MHLFFIIARNTSRWLMSMILPQLILAAVWLLAGLVMLKYPPKKINPLYGYRTMASMRSIEAWHYAQRLASRKFILTALLLFAVAIAEWIIEVSAPWHALTLIASLILALMYIVSSVEKQLTKRFPQAQ
jgi:uncharacterized membrane protein